LEQDVQDREGQPLRESPAVFPLFYNGPVQYFSRLIREKQVVLEQYDHYLKQTYRNRCRILGPNGVMTLSIPVKRIRGYKTLVRDIRIERDDPWNKIHWKSLEASYASSPFFVIIAEELRQIYESPPGFLVDLNTKLLNVVLEILDLDISLSLSRSFRKITGRNNLASFIHPKLDPRLHDPDFHPVPYHQVFSERHGFQPYLSILDLIFNEGPGSIAILNRSLRTSIRP
jgi:hypothetical protein